MCCLENLHKVRNLAGGTASTRLHLQELLYSSFRKTDAMHAMSTLHVHGNIAMPDGRQTIFLPVVGLVDPDSLKPGDLVGVNKDSYLILDTLPSEYDSRVKAMEVSNHVHVLPYFEVVLPCSLKLH